MVLPLILLSVVVMAALALPFLRGLRPMWLPIVLLAALGALSVILYMNMGRPDIPASPFDAVGSAEKETYRKLLLEEYSLNQRLAQTPDDVNVLIELAALRIAQGRDIEKTQALIAHAKTIAPKDRRIMKLDALMRAAAEQMKQQQSAEPANAATTSNP